MTSLSEPALDTSLEQLEELFNAPAYQNDKGYRLVFCDDDVTPQLYVVIVLIQIFGMTAKNAAALMLRVHNEGRGEVMKGSLEECNEKQKLVQTFNLKYGETLFSIVEAVE